MSHYCACCCNEDPIFMKLFSIIEKLIYNWLFISYNVILVLSWLDYNNNISSRLVNFNDNNQIYYKLTLLIILTLLFLIYDICYIKLINKEQIGNIIIINLLVSQSPNKLIYIMMMILIGLPMIWMNILNAIFIKGFCDYKSICINLPIMNLLNPGPYQYTPYYQNGMSTDYIIIINLIILMIISVMIIIQYKVLIQLFIEGSNGKKTLLMLIENSHLLQIKNKYILKQKQIDIRLKSYDELLIHDKSKSSTNANNSIPSSSQNLNNMNQSSAVLQWNSAQSSNLNIMASNNQNNNIIMINE